jgi:hypothetical protein
MWINMANKTLVLSVRLTNTDKNKTKDKIEDGLRIATLKSKSGSSRELLSIWKMNLQRRREYPTQRIGVSRSPVRGMYPQSWTFIKLFTTWTPYPYTHA